VGEVQHFMRRTGNYAVATGSWRADAGGRSHRVDHGRGSSPRAAGRVPVLRGKAGGRPDAGEHRRGPGRAESESAEERRLDQRPIESLHGGHGAASRVDRPADRLDANLDRRHRDVRLSPPRACAPRVAAPLGHGRGLPGTGSGSPPARVAGRGSPCIASIPFTDREGDPTDPS